jgi:hypothetical protein
MRLLLKRVMVGAKHEYSPIEKHFSPNLRSEEAKTLYADTQGRPNLQGRPIEISDVSANTYR